MPSIQNQKSSVKTTRDALGGDSSDLPPAYDSLSLHHLDYTDHADLDVNQTTSVLGPGPRNDPLDPALSSPARRVDKLLPPPPRIDVPPARGDVSRALTERPRPHKNTSWLSLLPFASSSTKRVRQSVSSTVSDLVVPPSRASEQQRNAHEVLASAAETCAEHKVSLSAILQETFITDHTPMYWAIVNYRQELLVALLAYAGSLSVLTISDIRRACLVSSNQALFHALRVCRPPFHTTDGIRVPSLRTASENLLLSDRPSDEVNVQRTNEKGFIVSFDVPLWQGRMKTIGQVSVEFIASGRMWSVTFFSTDPSLPVATSGKSRKGANTWHILISLLESSPPTFFDSKFVVELPSSSVPETIQNRRLREVRSATILSSGDARRAQPSTYDHDHDGRARLRSPRHPSKRDACPGSSSFSLPPPVHPLRGSLSQASAAAPPSIAVRLGCGSRKLARRAGTGDPTETRTTKSDTWSDHGVGYTNVAVASLGQGRACGLLYDHSPYLLPDGTLRGRLEARLEKTEETHRDCIIC